MKGRYSTKDLRITNIPYTIITLYLHSMQGYHKEAMTIWQLAAFTPPIFIRSHHMNQINYYHDLLYPTYHHQFGSTFMACSTRYSHTNSVRRFYASLHNSNAFYSSSLFGSSSNNIDTSSATHSNPQMDKQTTRIGIIGGGIAGVTAANALSNIFANDDSINAKIVVFEGQEEALSPINLNECEQPQWTAGERVNCNCTIHRTKVLTSYVTFIS